MKEYLYFYLEEKTGLHIVPVESDCTPNAARKAREIALPHDKRLSRCVLKSDGYSVAGITLSMMQDERTIKRCGRLPWELD